MSVHESYAKAMRSEAQHWRRIAYHASCLHQKEIEANAEKRAAKLDQMVASAERMAAEERTLTPP